VADDPYAAIAHDPYASIASPAPATAPSGGLDLGGIAKKVVDTADSVGRNFGAARTAAARDPVGATANILGAPERAVAGAVMAPMTDLPATDNNLGHSLTASARGAWRGITDPAAGGRYNQAFGDMTFNGVRPQGDSMPARIGRGAEDFALQTLADPVTHGGAQAMSGLLKGGKAAVGAAGRIPAVAKKVDAAKAVINDPKVAAAAGKVAHAIGTVNPIPGMVNAGKDMLFLNPLPHGLGNMTALNFLNNGLGTTLKGLKYGVTGAPKGSVDALNAMKAGAWTPELLDEPSPWGPVGWMSTLGKKGVPAGVRGGVGAASGGAIANQTAPSTATPSQRLQRVAEGSILGGLTGASPEALNLSNKLMTRLETGHRAAMLEGLPKPPPVAAAKIKLSPKDFIVYPSSGQVVLKSMLKPHGPAAAAVNEPLADNSIFNRVKAGKMKSGVLGNVDTETGEFVPRTMHQEAPISESKSGRIQNWPTAPGPKAKPPGAPDPRADAINAVFGGLDKSPAAKIATALGGPFAGWQADVVPRNVGNALVKHPERVEAFARGQDITNRDVLKGKPYKIQTGGPIGGAAELAFNTPKYASRLLGPLGGIDPNEATNPKTFSLKDKAGAAAYGATPGREVVGPFFGDTMFPSKAPAVPNAALGTALGWHFSNKTPATDAILQIMKSGPFTQEQAARLYERYKR